MIYIATYVLFILNDKWHLLSYNYISKKMFYRKRYQHFVETLNIYFNVVI